jgi:branched-chain amino acid transport system substrate-binding protein
MFRQAAVGIALGVSLMASTSVRAEDVKPIKIGSFVSITGQASFLGEPTQMTLDLFIEQINKSGGVNGRPIQLVLYDSKTSAKDAAALVRRLVDQDNVDLVIGGTSTGETMAALPYLEESHVPFISLGGASVIVNPVKRYVFKTPHTDQMSIEKVFTRVKDEKKSKVALLSGAGGYDQSCRKNANEMASRFGIQIVADEQHGAGDSDMTAQLTKIRSADADAILYCGFGAASSIVAKNYKQLGMTPTLYMTVGVASRAYIDGSDGAAEGSRVTGSALLAFGDLSPSDPIYGVTKKFVDAYVKAYKETPSNFAGYAYDALLLATEAIKKAGSTDKEKVRDALESLQGVPGTNGLYSFSPTDHLGFSAQSLRILEVKKDQYRMVN